MSTLERVIDQLANEETSNQLTTLDQELGEEWKRVVESLSPPTLENQRSLAPGQTLMRPSGGEFVKNAKKVQRHRQIR